jgi:TrmH family RNA methyltransferase
MLTNSQIKKYSSLRHKKYRKEYGLFIADGPHLVEAAINSKWQIEKVIVRPDHLEFAGGLGLKENLLAQVTPAQFDRIAPSQTPQGILAIVRALGYSSLLPALIRRAVRLVACDNIADPGNLGTIIRTAAALDYDAVLCVGECAEIYSPKTIRATQGAIFYIPAIEFRDYSEFLANFKDDFEIATFSNAAHMPLSDAPQLKRPLLVLGSETKGINPDIQKYARYNFRIEQSQQVESLNVSVAAGIAMYRFSDRHLT